MIGWRTVPIEVTLNLETAKEEDDNESVIEQDWGAVEIGAKSEKGEEKDEKADQKDEKKQDELEAIDQVINEEVIDEQDEGKLDFDLSLYDELTG